MKGKHTSFPHLRSNHSSQVFSCRMGFGGEEGNNIYKSFTNSPASFTDCLASSYVASQPQTKRKSSSHFLTPWGQWTRHKTSLCVLFCSPVLPRTKFLTDKQLLEGKDTVLVFHFQ